MVNIDWKANPAKTYRDLVLDFGQMAGYGKDKFPILKRAEHPEQWKAWYAYYRWRKLEFSQEILRTRDQHTVPTLSPFDFDLEFNPMGSLPEVPRGGDWEREPPLTVARMGFKMSVLSAGIAHGAVSRVAQANERGLEDLVALGQEWGVEVPEEVWRQMERAA